MFGVVSTPVPIEELEWSPEPETQITKKDASGNRYGYIEYLTRLPSVERIYLLLE